MRQSGQALLLDSARLLARGLRLAIVLCLLAAVLPVPGPPGAEAGRWPKSTVTFRDHSGYGASVKLAARWWNRLPSPLRLVRARPGRRANITIRSTYRRNDSAGWAYFPPVGRMTLNRRYMSAGGMTRVDRADIAAHEFGHALGIPHVRERCALMNAASTLSECRRGVPRGRFRCGPQRADLRSLVRRYGGRVRSFGGTFCGRKRRNPPQPPPHGDDIRQLPDTGTSAPGPGPEPGHLHRVYAELWNSDDTVTVLVNGRAFGQVGYGQSDSVDLGWLSDSDRVSFMAENHGSGYTWGWSLSSDGYTVAHDQEGEVGQWGANGNDWTTGVVRQVTYGAHGNVLGAYEAGE